MMRRIHSSILYCRRSSRGADAIQARRLWRHHFQAGKCILSLAAKHEHVPNVGRGKPNIDRFNLLAVALDTTVHDLLQLHEEVGNIELIKKFHALRPALVNGSAAPAYAEKDAYESPRRALTEVGATGSQLQDSDISPPQTVVKTLLRSCGGFGGDSQESSDSALTRETFNIDHFFRSNDVAYETVRTDVSHGSDSGDRTSRQGLEKECDESFSCGSSVSRSEIISVPLVDALCLLRVSTRTDWEAVRGALDIEEPGVESGRIEQSFDLDSVEFACISQRSTFEDVDAGHDVLFKVLHDVESGCFGWHIHDVNLLLASLATSVVLDDDDILKYLLNAFQSIRDLEGSSDGPLTLDATSHEIVLLTLIRRFRSYKAVQDFIRQMHSVRRLDANCLSLLFYFYEDQTSVAAAESLMEDLLCNSKRPYKIPISAFGSLLNLYILNGESERAANVLHDCLHESVTRHRDRRFDELLVSAIRWPLAKGNEAILNRVQMLEYASSSIFDQYESSNRVWRQFLLHSAALARTDKAPLAIQDKAWNLVRAALHAPACRSSLRLDEAVLDAALDAALALRDADCAADVTYWYLEGIGSANSTDSVANRESVPSDTAHKARQPSIAHMMKALEICVYLEDMDCATFVLEALHEFFAVPKPAVHAMYKTIIAGYGRAGNARAIVTIMEQMREQNLSLSEEDFAALMHAHLVVGEMEEMRAIMNRLLRHDRAGGDVAATPGARCYEVLLLAGIRDCQWDQVLRDFDEYLALSSDARICGERSSSPVALKPPAMTGVVVAAFMEGGAARIEAMVHKALEKANNRSERYVGLNINAGFALLAVCNMMPLVDRNEMRPAIDAAELRATLRRKVTSDNSDRDAAILSMVRALRAAELEEQRTPSRALPIHNLAQKRSTAWCAVLSAALRAKAVGVAL